MTDPYLLIFISSSSISLFLLYKINVVHFLHRRAGQPPRELTDENVHQLQQKTVSPRSQPQTQSHPSADPTHPQQTQGKERQDRIYSLQIKHFQEPFRNRLFEEFLFIKIESLLIRGRSRDFQENLITIFIEVKDNQSNNPIIQ
jgi:hypothetical protein